jgi:tRNA U34 2-thiouridine synthase MnmA/TrmU
MSARALALLSGGLDSQLAAMLAHRIGVTVVGIHFDMPFYPVHRRQRPSLGFEVRDVDISAEFLAMLAAPRYGFGSNMNPCIDCKILMVKKARSLLEEWGAQFIITGEVLGQRPMSQHRQALELIARRAGVEGLLVRPLCAQRLPETIPEQRGWIDRTRLLGITGRGRSAQFALAKEFGLTEYAQPGGGCLLTDPTFSRRLKDLMAHKGLDALSVRLLKLGRHFRLGDYTKLVVGRDARENEVIAASAAKDDCVVYPDETVAGPTSLLHGSITQEHVMSAARITARYCDTHRFAHSVSLCVRQGADEARRIEAAPADGALLATTRIA